MWLYDESKAKRYMSRSVLRSVVFDFAHGMCEWPACHSRATELAHIVSSGMGGDPQHLRDTVDNTFAACRSHARVSDGLPPPGGGLEDLIAEYLKVPGVTSTATTRDVLELFAQWLWRTRAQRKLLGDHDG